MRYPGATWKPIPINFTTGGIRPKTLGLILHVQVGNGELSGWFSNPKAQVSAHFWVSKTGAVYQYVDTSDKAWAQAAGNDDYLSVETEGLPTEPLTTQQITALGNLYRWGAQQFGWPNAQADAPGQRGLGWHGMGGAAWGNHPGCPGDLRKAQRPNIRAVAFPPAPKPPTPPQEPEVKIIVTQYTEPGHDPAALWAVSPDLTSRVWIHSANQAVKSNPDVYRELLATGNYQPSTLSPATVADIPIVGEWPPRVAAQLAPEAHTTESLLAGIWDFDNNWLL